MKYGAMTGESSGDPLPDNNEWVMKGKIRGLTHRLEEQETLIKALQKENDEIITRANSLIKQLKEKRLTPQAFAREIIDLFGEESGNAPEFDAE